MIVSEKLNLSAVDAKATTYQYDAFISYSHKADSELAKVLQVRLERWARPWFSARTARLFRDEVSLTATPHLWSTIATSLDSSKYLILLASTDSAKSSWVPREICYWLTGGKSDNPETLKPEQVIEDRVDRLMIVLTEGEIEWSHAHRDFDWATTSALHPVLRNLPWQPLWTDLRWARGVKAKQIEADERFTEPVLKLLSPIRGKNPQELLDANDKEQKRAVTLFRRLSIGLSVLFIVTLISAWFAFEQRNTAEQRLAETRLQNARRSLLSDRDASAGVLWLAETLQVSGSRAQVSRRSARRLLVGWQDSLPLHTLVHGSPVKHISWSADGRKIASTSGKQAYVWDAVKGIALGGPMEHDSVLSDVQFCANGNTIATSTGDPFTHKGQVFLWDIETQHKRELLSESEIYSLALAGKTLLVATDGGALRFDTETGKPIGKMLPHQGMVLFATISPDGKTIITGNGDFKGESEGDLRVWDADSSQLRFGPIEYENGATAFFSPTNNTLVVEYDGKTEERETATGKVVGSWENQNPQELSRPKSYDGKLRDKSYSPEGKMRATANDVTLQLWKVPTKENSLRNDKNVTAVSLSPNNRMIAIGCEDGTTWTWDLVSRLRDRMPFRSENNVKALSFSFDGSIMTIADSRNVRQWDLLAKRLVKEISIERGFEIDLVSISSNSKVIATTSLDVPQGGFEPPDGWINFTLVNGDMTSGKSFVFKGESVKDIAFSTDGKLLFSAWSDQEARLLDTATGEQVGESYHHLEDLQAVAISPDGSLLASATMSHLHIWSVKSGKLIGEKMLLPAAPSHVTFSPDSACVVTVMNQKLQIWDLATRCTVMDTLWYESTISAIEFLKTGHSLAIASAENVHFVHIPQPDEEDARTILLSVEARTASTIDSGVLRPLSRNEWLKKRSLLEQSGGKDLRRISSTK